jgi:hypothetical protein
MSGRPILDIFPVGGNSGHWKPESLPVARRHGDLFFCLAVILPVWLIEGRPETAHRY